MCGAGFLACHCVWGRLSSLPLYVEQAFQPAIARFRAESSLFQQAQFARARRGLGAVLDFQFAKDVVEVFLDGVNGDE